ncbi:MAG TPA: hypothetical protein VN441_17155 [Syntrophomonas sp.]|nr:hypothetical protein [Syntrophomonas sp.]
MSLLSREDFDQLLKSRDKTCLSIYMKTYRAGKETLQGRIRLKNLLQEAETRLCDSGMRRVEAEAFLSPLEDLTLNNQFWQNQRDGLAIFLSDNLFKYYFLPFEFDDFLHIGPQFHIKPLLPFILGDGRFYVLALSLNKVRFFQCSRASVREIEVDNIPSSLAEAMKFDDPQRQLQQHSNTLPGANSKAAAIFHGQGIEKDDRKNNILRYFRLIDKGLWEVLREEKSPLVLMGVDYLLPIYKEANTYAWLAPESLPGNPEELSGEDIQTLAMPLVEHYFHKAEQEALTYYGPFQGTGRTLKDIAAVIPASCNGQVELLFLADGQQWGRYDGELNSVTVHAQPEPGDDELYDLAIRHTILNGGSVYLMDQQSIPEGGDIAALLRY